jgi:hypothetical protein
MIVYCYFPVKILLDLTKKPQGGYEGPDEGPSYIGVSGYPASYGWAYPSGYHNHCFCCVDGHDYSFLVGAAGIEPTFFGLKGRCKTNFCYTP